MPRVDNYYKPRLPPLIEASGTTALIAAAGTLNFTLQTWAAPLWLEQVWVTSLAAIPSVNFDFEIYEDAARTLQRRAYRFASANIQFNDSPIKAVPYRAVAVNSDPIAAVAAEDMYCRLINTDPANASTFFVIVRYQIQGGSFDNAVTLAIPAAAVIG